MIEAVDAVGHDHIAERHIATLAGADAAHREARGPELVDERRRARGGRHGTHRASPRRRHAERLARAVRQHAEADVIAQLPPLVGPAALGEHGVELGLERDDDQHVDRRKLRPVQHATRRGHVSIIGRQDGTIKPCANQLSSTSSTFTKVVIQNRTRELKQLAHLQ